MGHLVYAQCFYDFLAQNEEKRFPKDTKKKCSKGFILYMSNVSKILFYPSVKVMYLLFEFSVMITLENIL